MLGDKVNQYYCTYAHMKETVQEITPESYFTQ